MLPQIAEPWRQFTEELGFTPALDGPYDTLMQGWRSIMGKLLARYTFPAPDLTVHTEDVSADGVRVRIYTPPALSETGPGPEPDTHTEASIPGPSPDDLFPVALYFHAGGWIMGSVDEEDGFVRALCKLTRSRILSIDYRLAPAHPFPIPLNDCLAAARWALATFPSQSIALIGASAGGNMALATALSLIESEDENASKSEAQSRIQGVVALAPVTIHPDAVPAHLHDSNKYTSYAENDRATINTESAMRTFFDCYGAPPDDPRVSVLLHPRLSALSGKCTGTGRRRVYLAVGGADTLRDDVRLLAERLREEQEGGDEATGVAVQLDEYPGFPHFSWLFPAGVLGGHQREFMGNLVRGIKWVQGS
ncbi:lipase/esterase [Aspergillus ustus]|uniref:Lipase/esterase n=1 Tax=Aspergillus ustus TaxID=40382 RepID=A0A0C1C3L5_ASPUT|nr:lipase/esterase [Aspergillus ustus]